LGVIVGVAVGSCAWAVCVCWAPFGVSVSTAVGVVEDDFEQPAASKTKTKAKSRADKNRFFLILFFSSFSFYHPVLQRDDYKFSYITPN
jgi:hypothetical protein